ncbi:hypothetical protein ACFX2J_035919 [Malus domestica]
MASNYSKSPTTTFTTLLFFLLITFQITMAKKKHSFPIPPVSSTSSRSHGVGVISKKNVIDEYATRRSSHGIIDSKADHEFTGESGRRRGLGFRVRRGRQPFPWKENMFRAGAHEVPSGPNPISNR